MDGCDAARRWLTRLRILLPLLAALASSCAPPLQAETPLPRPDHVVILIEENHRAPQIIGNAAAPYLNALAEQGALFTRSFAVTHPSQPNYLHVFSGASQGCSSDFTTVNRIATSFVGPIVKPGQYGERINHHSLLRTLEEMYGLDHARASATATPIVDVWTGPPGSASP